MQNDHREMFYGVPRLFTIPEGETGLLRASSGSIRDGVIERTCQEL